MQKKLKSLLFVLVFAWILNPQMIRARHEIVASVNDKPISRTDLLYKTKLLLLFSGQEDSDANRKMFEKEALKTLIREMLQMQFMEKLGIKFSDKEYADAIERLELMNEQNPGFLLELTKKHGISSKILRLSVISNYAWELFISERYKSMSQPSALEVQKRLDIHQKNRNNPHVRLAELVVPFEGGASENSAKETMEHVLNMLQEGASFVALVQQFSKAPSAVRGGDLGWMTVVMLEPEIQKAIQGLQVNRITPPLRMKNSYKIFFVIDRREKSPEPKPVTTYTYVQAFIPKPKGATVAEQKRVEETARAVQQTARSEAMLKSFLKNVVGHQIKSFDQKEEKELSPAIWNQIKNLKAGEATPLVERLEGYYVVILTKKQTYSGEELLKQNAESELRYQKLITFSHKEMKNVRRSAHVEIRAEEFSGMNLS